MEPIRPIDGERPAPVAPVELRLLTSVEREAERRRRARERARKRAPQGPKQPPEAPPGHIDVRA